MTTIQLTGVNGNLEFDLASVPGDDYVHHGEAWYAPKDETRIVWEQVPIEVWRADRDRGKTFFVPAFFCEPRIVG